jgi:hypothetical protein
VENLATNIENMKLCLGGGFEGMIKNVDFFKMPLSLGEARSLYNSVNLGASCT